MSNFIELEAYSGELVNINLSTCSEIRMNNSYLWDNKNKRPAKVEYSYRPFWYKIFGRKEKILERPYTFKELNGRKQECAKVTIYHGDKLTFTINCTSDEEAYDAYDEICKIAKGKVESESNRSN